MARETKAVLALSALTWRALYRACVGAVCLGLLSACSTPIRVKVSNHNLSNLNNRGDNVPVTLIIYQLKDAKRFEYASLSDLTTREAAALGRDKIDAMRVQIPPNESDVLVAEIAKKEGKYIGVMALFANPKDKKQKYIKKLNRVFSNTIKLDITPDGIHKAQKRQQRQEPQEDKQEISESGNKTEAKQAQPSSSSTSKAKDKNIFRSLK